MIYNQICENNYKQVLSILTINIHMENTELDQKQVQVVFQDGKQVQISEEAGVMVAAHLEQQLLREEKPYNSFDQADQNESDA